jgi:hypothetical protein
MRLLILIAVLAAVWLLLTRGSGGAGGNLKSPSEPPAAPPPAPADADLPGQEQSVPDSGDNPGSGNDMLDNILQGIFQFEGGRPGNRNVVNNNPGNLKSGANMTGRDQGGFATFADEGDGWDALTGYVTTGVKKHPDWDFYDFFDFYLRGKANAPPVDDQGNSDTYAEYVANYAGADPSQTMSSALGWS